MFRIGEFSKLTQVSVRMLRYYDETGLLKPAKTDPWTGYRLYSAEQIRVLNRIVYLRDSGFQVAEIAAALSCGDDAGIVEMLERKYSEVESNIRAEQVKLDRISVAKREILRNSDMHYHVSIKSVPSYLVLSYRKLISDYYAEGQMWKELSAFARQHDIDASDRTFSIYHDEDYREKDVDVELCAPVNKTGQSAGLFVFRHTEPVSSMACTIVFGDFSNIAGVYRAFAEWLQENSQFKMGGTSRQIVYRGPWNEEDPSQYVTEIQIPLIQTS